jgi:hypothetical protein
VHSASTTIFGNLGERTTETVELRSEAGPLDKEV